MLRNWRCGRRIEMRRGSVGQFSLPSPSTTIDLGVYSEAYLTPDLTAYFDTI